MSTALEISMKERRANEQLVRVAASFDSRRLLFVLHGREVGSRRASKLRKLYGVEVMYSHQTKNGKRRYRWIRSPLIIGIDLASGQDQTVTTTIRI